MTVMSKLSIAAVIASSAIAASASAALVAGWTITTAFPTGTGNVPTGQTYTVGAANDGLQTVGSELKSVHALAAATYTSPSGNGSAYSFSSNNWSIGDYYEARVSTTGYTDISISWDQTRSATGPITFDLIMSTDGGASFTTLLAGYTVLQSGGGGAPGTWTSATYNPIYSFNQAASAADNQTEVIFRLRSLVNPGGATGSNRIDNVMIYSGPVPAPGAIALLGVAGVAGLRRRR